MIDVIASEAVKTRTVRSTTALVGSCAAAIAVGAAMALISAGVWDASTTAERSSFGGVGDGTDVLFVVRMCLLALGILAATSEYGSGMIRTSLTAVPARRELVLAKACVVAALTLVVGEIVAVLTFLASRLIIGNRAIGDLGSVTDGLPLILSEGLAMTVIALLGFGAGLLLKSTAGALVAMAVLLFGVPMLPLLLLPEPWGARIAAVMPSELATELGASTHLSPLGALVAMTAWVAVALYLGVRAVARRDA
ncbi:ABC transporter permease [Actinokineospora diospyrosa]|uniref:ABC-2 family transporter protein n=1 Tax=Actinokineospora diospyrosa TaxID=103728 RepID=A0ABT1ICT9_9PSEU|nr:ABC transporter permease [Actinokineospora diospyrosa]MCP2270166.1 ABC-2 family transporter protein [Actinokineospora diospyrosa]